MKKHLEYLFINRHSLHDKMTTLVVISEVVVKLIKIPTCVNLICYPIKMTM